MQVPKYTQVRVVPNDTYMLCSICGALVDEPLDHDKFHEMLAGTMLLLLEDTDAN